MKFNLLIEVDGENVKVLSVKKVEPEVIEVENQPLYELASDYARLFDDCSPMWTKDAEYNRMFLKDRQRYANGLLKARGHLFLNDVHDMLGLPRTKTGQIVGWVYDKDDPLNDNFVDFDLMNERNKDFINGRKNTAILDFNVYENILDRI